MKALLSVACALLLGALTGGARPGSDPPRGPIFPRGEKPFPLFTGGFSTEGPAVCPVDSCVYFSDQTFTAETHMLAGIIWKHNPRTGQTTVYRSPSGMANGIKFDAASRMLVAEGADYGGRRITRTDVGTGKAEIIAALYQGKPYNSPNDLVIDSRGRIYFTDPRYVGHEPIEQPVMGVYRRDPDGSVALIIDDVSMPNGIALSPDERTLYVGCNDEGEESPGGRAPRMAILAYDLLPRGDARFARVLVDCGTGGGPDGLAVDTEGNLYAAIRAEARPAIRVFRADGAPIDSLLLPEVPSNLAFGRGPLQGKLFITAGKSLYHARVLKHGLFPKDKRVSSSME